MPKHTPKQLKFCLEYPTDLNGTQAAIRAGYSKKTANRIASKLLSKVDIQQTIQENQKKLQEKTELTQERVINNILKGIAISEGVEPHLVSIKVTGKDGKEESKTIEILKTDLPNFFKGNELLMKHLGLFEKDNRQKEAIQQVQIFKLPDNNRD